MRRRPLSDATRPSKQSGTRSPQEVKHAESPHQKAPRSVTAVQTEAVMPALQRVLVEALASPSCLFTLRILHTSSARSRRLLRAYVMPCSVLKPYVTWLTMEQVVVKKLNAHYLLQARHQGADDIPDLILNLDGIHVPASQLQTAE
jgi:hypothetical protein